MAHYTSHTQTIIAQATPSGRGGIGVIRVSGPLAPSIAKTILGRSPQPRTATFARFWDLDEGIVLFFPAPHSFTGEDVLELQGHGGPVILDLLIQKILTLHPDIRIAKPGEFSERAFLNDKIDLTQAEAIADLIDASSAQAAKLAIRSLQGAFRERIHKLLEKLIHLRTYIEAAIDFAEEEIDFLSPRKIGTQLEELLTTCQQCLKAAAQGVILKEGFSIVLTGRPNAGKSSLLNALTGADTAIVTPIAGTTRDVLKEHIHMDGIPLHLIDTAGIRDNPDVIEEEGIKRAWQELEKADYILLVADGDPDPDLLNQLKAFKNLIVIRNKCDLRNEIPNLTLSPLPTITLSAKTGEGLPLLKQYLKEKSGLEQKQEGGFLARRRHLEALKEAETAIQQAKQVWQEQSAGELMAEELKIAQQALTLITGEFTTDDLLGKIFSSFCVGK